MEQEELIIMKARMFHMYSGIVSLIKQNAKEKDERRRVLEVFGDESGVGDLSWYGGNHQCPSYLKHSM